MVFIFHFCGVMNAGNFYADSKNFKLISVRCDHLLERVVLYKSVVVLS